METCREIDFVSDVNGEVYLFKWQFYEDREYLNIFCFNTGIFK